MLKNWMPAAVTAAMMMGTAAFADETLRFATWDSNESLEIQKSIAKMFEAAHPGVTVQVESYGDGFDTKLAAGLAPAMRPMSCTCGISRPMKPRFCR